ncbi:D-glycero-beta-D-manno-heptose 1,7-bisphosphate 7-phosphatase [Castellaniella sp.]|uniref:D-glycero-beta-D-manno-heptose 1,7-bisphosphate 7-phosphatase n=1 Tax=Castellaniella sp. TaxID=1955812 RepID=UPI002AFE7490|nr:D-glycero-beta-D-manno-heptose 1,7-bisphosphate 7-phosphatase [Castellaniella sp.]
MKLIILDRDGVINQDSDDYIKSPDEWEAIPGSLEAIGRLSQAGWRVVVATNQSGLARGLFSMETLGAIHQRMLQAVSAAGGQIDAIFFCPHKPDENCDCRKPKPGMLHDIARRLDVRLEGIPFVGDTLRDLQAGATVGCAPWLVLTGKGRKTWETSGTCGELPAGTEVRDDLAAVVDALLKVSP